MKNKKIFIEFLIYFFLTIAFVVGSRLLGNLTLIPILIAILQFIDIIIITKDIFKFLKKINMLKIKQFGITLLTGLISCALSQKLLMITVNVKSLAISISLEILSSILLLITFEALLYSIYLVIKISSRDFEDMIKDWKNTFRKK